MTDFYEINNQITKRLLELVADSDFEWQFSKKINGFLADPEVWGSSLIAISRSSEGQDSFIRIFFCNLNFFGVDNRIKVSFADEGDDELYPRKIADYKNEADDDDDDDEGIWWVLSYEYEPEQFLKLAANPPTLSELLLMTAEARANGQYDRAAAELSALLSLRTKEEQEIKDMIDD